MRCALGVLALLCGCELAETPPGTSPRPRGLDARNSSSATSAEAPADNTAEHSDLPGPSLNAPGSADEEDPPVEPTTPEEPPEPEEPPARDLDAELRAALGSVLSCLQPRQAGEGPPELSVSVAATVVTTGLVTRAEASSTTLAPEERECVRQRALSARIRAPIEDAPRTLNATLTLKLQP